LLKIKEVQPIIDRFNKIVFRNVKPKEDK